jgi:hypothetical protein
VTIDEPVYVDRDMWEKIVLNLISNAFKFTLEGTITVSLRPSEGGVDLLVRDTGLGMPAAELPRVFERFHRVEGQRGRSQEGSGIGLALVEELVKLHSGSISVSSVLGQGTQFNVSIPVGRGHPRSESVDEGGLPSMPIGASPFVEEALGWLPDEAALPAERPSQENPTSTNEQPRIVLADDNADMRAYVAQLLRQDGYAVEVVADGEAALSRVRQGPLYPTWLRKPSHWA